MHNSKQLLYKVITMIYKNILAQNYRSMYVRLNKKDTTIIFNPEINDTGLVIEPGGLTGSIDYNYRVYNFQLYSFNNKIAFDEFLPEYLYIQFCRLIRKYKQFK